jgi:hypothetical protein
MARLFRWCISVVLLVACGSSFSAETIPCGQFHDFAVDATQGVLTAPEFRARLQKIDERSFGSEVQDEARAMLAAYTQQGEGPLFNAAVSSMSTACDSYR